MAAYVKFYGFTEKMAEKVHNLGSDSLIYWLSNTAPSQANTVRTDITEITYTNLSSRAVTVSSSALNGSNEYVLVLADKVLTASGGTVGPFRYVGVYNDTATSDDLVGGYYDYGSSITLADGETFTIDHDPTNGFFKVA
jgi:hypothetical protein